MSGDSAVWVSPMNSSDLAAVREILETSPTRFDPEAELARSFAWVWVLRLESASSAPVGFLLAWSVADEVHLLEIATHAGQRRRGIARRLLGALLERAELDGKRLVLLEVRRSNQAAIALYDSLGFVTTGVRRGYYSDNGEDALEMRLSIAPPTNAVRGDPNPPNRPED
jgi:[ribosomal protein S18]-alanine N-acetyltransferase